MKRLMIIATLCCLCSLPSPAATYYMSATGSDVNSGTDSASPWASPNHSLNCGDVIIASGSVSYAAGNFARGKWGTVTCAAGNNVAWLECATFDACKISVTSGSLYDMEVSASYWGVQGWEGSNSAGAAGAGCFTAGPPNYSTTIHHIIFANDIANVCALEGFGSGPLGSVGVDYLAVVGNIVYMAGITNSSCGSGIGAYEPVASDSLPGTHIYVANNFVFSNSNGPTPDCYDGNGIIMTPSTATKQTCLILILTRPLSTITSHCPMEEWV